MWSSCVKSWPVGQLFVMCAPAGTGKTTLAKRLALALSNVGCVPTVTTRPKRAGEVPDQDYIFVTKEKFDSMLHRGELLEHIELHGYWYGTSKCEIDAVRNSGKHAILVIDTRGALALRTFFSCVLIFIKPPSLEVLRQRLEGRATEDAESISKRLAWAEQELKDETYFDYSLVNEDVDLAFQVLSGIIVAESHRVR